MPKGQAMTMTGTVPLRGTEHEHEDGASLQLMALFLR
jgi:hypothetical protein